MKSGEGSYRNTLSDIKNIIVSYPEFKLLDGQRDIMKDGLMNRFQRLEDESYPLFSGYFM